MYLHLGNNAVIRTDKIIGIFDLDNTTVSARTRRFLARAEKEGNVIMTSAELPKSFVVASGKKGENRVYLSQLSPATLGKRKMIYKNI
ncbi:MAG: DUF370 domain-containing protein [Clostridia bacterium]|nr:DUF370 domain-containing protein [Clostridia bacterium]